MITRRVLTALGLLALAPFPGTARAAAGGPRLASPEPMDLDRLNDLARSLRDRPYAPPPEAPAAKALDALTYGPLQEIRYPPGRALFSHSPYPVTFFHLGNFFRALIDEQYDQVALWLIRSNTLSDVLQH